MRAPKTVFILALALGAMLALAPPSAAAPNCDRDGDGYIKAGGSCGGNDCNDNNSSINPGAAEICGDGVDNNCDGQIDEGCGGPFCGDGTVNQPSEQCDGADDAACPGLCQSDCTCGGGGGGSCDRDNDGFLKNNKKCGGNDCNDGNAAINPGAAEVCGDGVDNNCDGQIDEGCGNPPICGDNIVNQPSEQCDGADDAACPGLCQGDCTCGTPPAVCGDNIVNQPSEQCDGTDDAACPGLCQGDCTCGQAASLPSNIAAAGDSITQAFAADCTCNTNFFCLLCLLGGDQPENSWFDGSSGNVTSVHDRYLALDGTIGSNKSAAADGSEMRGSGNSFSVQADAILAQTPVADHVEVELGGNDICNRDCVNSANCTDPLYTDQQWTDAVRAGLDKLVAGLPDGSTIYLMGVPRVQDLRQAGLDKQAGSGSVDCEGVWIDYGICTIGTLGSALNGESVGTRLAGIAERQQRYNEILRDEAAAYNTNSNGRNPRGIEVIADYVDEATPSTGTTGFGAAEIDGGDCFHPSIFGQNTVAEISWQGNTDR